MGLCWLATTVNTDKGPWYSILPPLIAVTFAFLTHKIQSSLVMAVLLGGILATVPDNPSLFGLGAGVVKGGGFVWSAVSDFINFQILAFVAFILAMISVLVGSGALLGVVNYLGKYAKTRRSTQFITVLTGFFLFFDDYANTMIVGSAMRPATDKKKISREKLAFLVDATSAPIAGIAIISTWIGYEVGLFGETLTSLNIAKDGYSAFFDALPFRFYCLMMIAFVVINTLSGEDFGPMKAAEERAKNKGQLFAPDAKILSKEEGPLKKAAPAKAAMIPLLSMLLFVFAGIWIDGGGQNLLSLTAWRMAVSGASNSILVLMYASLFGLFMAGVCAYIVGRTPKQILGFAFKGLKASALPIVILVLAWSLKGACDSLKTGAFLTASLGDTIPPLLFPTLLFLVASVTAFATGTSWGTMAILIPTAAPVAFSLDGDQYGLVMMMSFAAVLDGAILGDHCSPISDTTIMSSVASHCDHIDHVETQLPYALLVGFLAIVCGYLPAAAGFSPWSGLLLAIMIMVTLFFSKSLLGFARGGWRRSSLKV